MRGILETLKTSMKVIFVLGCVSLLNGCVNTAKLDTNIQDFKHILEYESSLGALHHDTESAVFHLEDTTRGMVRNKFKSSSKHRSARMMAEWLMQVDGHNMTYDISANFSPNEAFKKGRANCLSFSLLLIELAKELNIDLALNQVDLPEVWGENENQDLVFYRHVNVVYKTHKKTQIFDLALNEYRAGFPQRIIKKRQGMALLFSNIGIQKLQAEDLESAFHYLKLAVSIYPKNADMWINLGAAYKQYGDFTMAKKLYLKAYSINDQNSLAASSLERIYRNEGANSKARFFEKRAKHARLRNPYVQYRLALKAFDEKSMDAAKKSIKRAIRLHNSDPKFYELSSRINQAQQDHVAAIKDIHKAYTLSQESFQRGRYAHKVEMIVARAKAQAEEKIERENQTKRFDTIDPLRYPNAVRNF